MASSEKSQRLGLSLWKASDRPERLDFRQDNERLELLLGNHLEGAAQHLTPDQKTFLEKPYWLQSYCGTGYSTMNYTLQTVPKAVIVLCSGYPPTMPRADGRQDVYWDYWADVGGNQVTAGLGGVTVDLERKRLTMIQGESEANRDRMYHQMNAKGVWYTIIYIGRTG